MGWIWLMSCRQLRFYWRQAILSVLGIAVGVLVLMVILSFAKGINQHFVEGILKLYPHITMEAGINSEVETDLMENIAEVEGVNHVAPYLTFPGLIKRGLSTETVSFKGVDYKLEDRLHHISHSIEQGNWEAITENQGAILGSELARQIGAEPGDWIEVITPQGANYLVVEGTFYTGHYPYDGGLVILPLKTAQRLMNTTKVTGYGVSVADLDEIDSYILPLQKATGLWVRPWYEQQRGLFISLNVQREVMIWISSFTFLVAAFGVANIFLLRALYQQRTVGILRSLGARTVHIVGGLIIQGLLCGLVGGGLGLVFARVTVAYLEKYPLSIPEIYYSQTLPIQWAAENGGFVLLIAVIASGLAVIYPALRLGRIDPAEVVKHGSY